MVRRIFCISAAAFLILTAPVFSEQDSAAKGHWFVGVATGYTQPYFFGLINDIYATAPAAMAAGILAGREHLLSGQHHYGFEFFASRTFFSAARQEGFTPTFSTQYPQGSVIHYRSIAQTLCILSITYRYALVSWLSLSARLGAGARYTQAVISLETSSASLEAASPAGVMAIVSAALGGEITLGIFGQLGIFYRSVPAVVYPVAVGTATVRAGDMLTLEWRYLFPE